MSWEGTHTHTAHICCLKLAEIRLKQRKPGKAWHHLVENQSERARVSEPASSRVLPPVLLPVWPWASDWTSLDLYFLISKVRGIGLEELSYCSHFECKHTFNLEKYSHNLCIVTKSCPTIYDLIDCSPPWDCHVHGLQYSCLSMGFSRQEYWSGLPFPAREKLPNPGIEPASPALTSWFSTTEASGKPSQSVPRCKDFEGKKSIKTDESL